MKIESVRSYTLHFQQTTENISLKNVNYMHPCEDPPVPTWGTKILLGEGGA